MFNIFILSYNIIFKKINYNINKKRKENYIYKINFYNKIIKNYEKNFFLSLFY